MQLYLLWSSPHVTTAVCFPAPVPALACRTDAVGFVGFIRAVSGPPAVRLPGCRRVSCSRQEFPTAIDTLITESHLYGGCWDPLTHHATRLFSCERSQRCPKPRCCGAGSFVHAEIFFYETCSNWVFFQFTKKAFLQRWSVESHITSFGGEKHP